MVHQNHTEAITAISDKVMYGGAAGSIFFGLTASEFGILVGAFCAIAGFLVSWYYKHKAYMLKKGLHDKLMDEEE
jgi:hypothetical protein